VAGRVDDLEIKGADADRVAVGEAPVRGRRQGRPARKKKVFSASASWMQMGAPVAAFNDRFPETWSQWRWVLTTETTFSPFSRMNRRTGPIFPAGSMTRTSFDVSGPTTKVLVFKIPEVKVSMRMGKSSIRFFFGPPEGRRAPGARND